MEIIRQALKQHFGHEEFREGQIALVEAALGGRDVLGIMPTGGGKSVCYQLPAVILEGITLVISPLISLMKDQIHSLKENGIPAAYINSTLSEEQISLVLERAAAGEYKILYVAPERLLSPRFTGFCQKANIPLVAIDEAHCVSQWGQDFRPTYSGIADFIAGLRARPIAAAFTATATDRVRADIVRLLRLKDPYVQVSGFDRKNLFFEVRRPAKKYAELLKILAAKRGQFGIVYCSTRKTVDEVCARLNEDGFSAARYHAGLGDNERHKNQEDFIYDRVNIIVATNAFGMGIDKDNVSFVIHYNMPKDIESYYQEAGRAGRDGAPADCVLLFSGQDVRTGLFLIENSEGKQYESEEQRVRLQEQERARLKIMETYCRTSECLRNYILKHFGEAPAKACGHCGGCALETEEIDITVLAQKILSCIVRTKESYGKGMIIDILRGSRNERVLRARLNSLPVYGICSESAKQLQEIVHYLAEIGIIRFTHDQYPVMQLGEGAREILKGQKTLTMQRAAVKKDADPKRGKESPLLQNPALYLRLKEVRSKVAAAQGVPAYVVFHDSALMEMSAALPASLAAFAKISGVGARKLEEYGDIFVGEIIAYAQENGLVTAEDETNVMMLTEREAPPPDYYALNFDSIEVSAEELQVSEIALRICECIEAQGIKKVAPRTVNDWLADKGLLDFAEDGEGKRVRVITQAGQELGIRGEQRTNQNKGKPYTVLLYSAAVQSMIKQKLPELLEFRDSVKGKG